MARHRCDDEQLRLRAAEPRRGALEMDELTEGPLPHDILGDGDFFALDGGRLQPEGRLAVAPRHALEQFRGGGEIAPEIGVAQWVQRVLEDQAGRVRYGSSGR